MPPRLSSFAALLAATTLFLPFGSAAQEVPPTVDPGRIQKRFERPPQPRTSESELTEGPEQLQLPPNAEQVRFVLRSVEVDGATVFSASELEGIWAPSIGQDISVADLFSLAAELTVRYRNAGYVLARAIVPPQEATNGDIRLQVIEGFVRDVSIDGEIVRPALFDAWMEKIRASKPLRAEVLERTLLLMNDLPGVSVRAVLRPSSEPGASDLVFVAARDDISAFADLNNRGTRFLGRYQGEFGIAFESWTGRGENTDLRVVQTADSELTLVALTHTETLNAEGTLLQLSGAYVDTEPGATLRPFGVEGESVSASLALLHPFIRSRSRNLTGYLRFDYLDAKNDSDLGLLTEDRLRVLRIGAVADWVDRFEGVNLVSAQLSRGFDIFSATNSSSPFPSREGGESAFTSVTARASRLQRIPGPVPGLNLFVQASGQYAFDRLLAPEQFGFGGDDFGRGYDPADLTGDHGLATLIEIQLGRTIGAPGLESVQFFASYDYGAVWQRNRSLPGGRRTTASSAAVGARLNFTPSIAGRLMVARPLTRASRVDRSDGFRHTRFFFGLTWRY